MNIDLYKMPIKTAMIVFPFLSLLFAIPYMIFRYRKNGAIIFWRTLVIYVFIYYLLNIYFLVILPLPRRHLVANMTGPKYDLKLFHFISNWRSIPGLSFKQISTWKLLLKEHNFLGASFKYYYDDSFWCIS